MPSLKINFKYRQQAKQDKDNPNVWYATEHWTETLVSISITLLGIAMVLGIIIGSN